VSGLANPSKLGASWPERRETGPNPDLASNIEGLSNSERILHMIEETAQHAGHLDFVRDYWTTGWQPLTN
jgi:hypothetical protein